MPTPVEIAAPAQCPNRRAWLFPVIATVVVAAVLRLWATAGLSLVVTNDGTGYIQMAERFSRGEGMLVGVLRTPGYPAMLGVVVWLCGKLRLALEKRQASISPASTARGCHGRRSRNAKSRRKTMPR